MGLGAGGGGKGRGTFWKGTAGENGELAGWTGKGTLPSQAASRSPVTAPGPTGHAGRAACPAPHDARCRWVPSVPAAADPFALPAWPTGNGFGAVLAAPCLHGHGSPAWSRLAWRRPWGLSVRRKEAHSAQGAPLLGRVDTRPLLTPCASPAQPKMLNSLGMGEGGSGPEPSGTSAPLGGGPEGGETRILDQHSSQDDACGPQNKEPSP